MAQPFVSQGLAVTPCWSGRVGERIAFTFLESMKYVGDSVLLDVLRQGELKRFEVRSWHSLACACLAGMQPQSIQHSNGSSHATAQVPATAWALTSTALPHCAARRHERP